MLCHCTPIATQTGRPPTSPAEESSTTAADGAGVAPADPRADTPPDGIWESFVALNADSFADISVLESLQQSSVLTLIHQSSNHCHSVSHRPLSAADRAPRSALLALHSWYCKTLGLAEFFLRRLPFQVIQFLSNIRRRVSGQSHAPDELSHIFDGRYTATACQETLQ